MLRQPVLKPQDVLVVLKLCTLKQSQNYSALAAQLSMSSSEVHAAVGRALRSRLLNTIESKPVPNRAAIREFLVHAIRYCFPLSTEGIGRGMPTGVSAPPLDALFAHSDALPLVWPDKAGFVRGIMVTPLFRSVPEAARMDDRLYRLLALTDALRGGAAREREEAMKIIDMELQ